MKNFINCEEIYLHLGKCWHIWSGEQFESFLNTNTDFSNGMGIIAISSKLCPDVKILTFELMSNHLHICAAGEDTAISTFMAILKKILRKAFASIEKPVRWDDFSLHYRELDSLEDTRNVIAYINRNGYIVNKNHTPFSYPWGANSFFYNTYKISVSKAESKPTSLRERRVISHSRIADNIEGLSRDNTSISPLCFCDIDTACALFRNASHYFYKISRNIEADRKIAKECGERIFYTDDELYSAACGLAQKKYDTPILSCLNIESKIEMAKTLHWDYNANPRQISRILKLEQSVICQMLGIIMGE